jgi:hypothetical protein
VYTVEDFTGWDLGYPDLFAINASDWVVGVYRISTVRSIRP